MAHHDTDTVPNILLPATLTSGDNSYWLHSTESDKLCYIYQGSRLF